MNRKLIPSPEASKKFLPPKLFPIPSKESFKPLTLREFKNKLKRTKVLEPIDKTETFETEIKNLELIRSPETMVTPRPLCCRAFLTSLATAKHVLLCHENFRLDKEQMEKPKYATLLNSRVNVRVTNLSKLPLNHLSSNEILQQAEVIVSRQETDDRMVTRIVNDS